MGDGEKDKHPDIESVSVHICSIGTHPGSAQSFVSLMDLKSSFLLSLLRTDPLPSTPRPSLQPPKSSATTDTNQLNACSVYLSERGTSARTSSDKKPPLIIHLLPVPPPVPNNIFLVRIPSWFTIISIQIMKTHLGGKHGRRIIPGTWLVESFNSKTKASILGLCQ